MLKAQLVKTKGEEAIYFKDKPDRTISLESCIKKVFTDKNGGLRKNLERVNALRNTSTHFITEDYEYIFVPLFQACVVNFVNKIKEFHDINMSDYIPQNFITLSVKVEKSTNEEIKAKYSKKMAQKIIKDAKEIENKINTLNSEFSIPIEARLFITKDRKKADFFVGIDNKQEDKIKIVTHMKTQIKNFHIQIKMLLV